MIKVSMTTTDKKGLPRLNQQHRLQLVLVAVLCALALFFSALVDRTFIQAVFLTMDVPVAELDPEENAELLQYIKTIQEQKFWQINAYTVQDQIKSLNWVDDVYVRKHWPDKVELKVVVARPVAAWNDGFLSAKGDFIKASRSQTGLPKVYAPESLAKTAAQMLVSIIGQLGPVEELSMDTRGEVKVTLPTGLKINLGTGQFALHLERTKQIINKKNAQDRQLASIDLRYSGGAAVSWHGHPKPTKAF